MRSSGVIIVFYHTSITDASATTLRFLASAILLTTQPKQLKPKNRIDFYPFLAVPKMGKFTQKWYGQKWVKKQMEWVKIGDIRGSRESTVYARHPQDRLREESPAKAKITRFFVTTFLRMTDCFEHFYMNTN
jgi:hypothetical protein